MMRRSLALMGCFTAILLVAAEPAPKPASKVPAIPPGQLAGKQEELARLFKQLSGTLLTMADKLEKSSKAEDQDRAKLIRRALELSEKEGVENKFNSILRTLSGSTDNQTQIDLTRAANQNEELLAIMRQILAILQSDDELARIREEMQRLEVLLKDLKLLIRDTKIERANGLNPAAEKKELAEGQKTLKDRTEGLASKMGAKGEPKDGKPGEPKDGKPGEPKDGKPGEPKDGKPGEAKDGQAGPPKDGQPGQPKDGQPGQPGNAKPTSPGGEDVRKAVPDQEQAKQKIEEDKQPEATKKQTDAIEKLERAQAELEKRLKQLREEELLKMLANLEARCQKMLQMQIEVYQVTKALHAIVLKNPGQKATKPEEQKAGTQADKEGDIVSQADKTIEILKAEGSSVAFPAVFEEVRRDMARVQQYLATTRVDNLTQDKEEDIIAALKEMIEALKKQQQSIQSGQSSGQPGDGMPPDQKLLDELAELRLIKSLQVKVNTNTKKRGGEVEQNDDPDIRQELKDLSDSQRRIEVMAKDIAEGKNK